MLFLGGYEFLDPPPQITAKGVVAAPSDSARKLNARIAFFYPYTAITPAMCMYVTGIGSQYLVTMRGAEASTSTVTATTGSRSRRISPRAASGRSCSITRDTVDAADRAGQARHRQPDRHGADRGRRNAPAISGTISRIVLRSA
jgi:hypothetical protein